MPLLWCQAEGCSRTAGLLLSQPLLSFPECDAACVGCTGKGPGRCKGCVPGYAKESGQCAGQCVVRAGHGR